MDIRRGTREDDDLMLGRVVKLGEASTVARRWGGALEGERLLLPLLGLYASAIERAMVGGLVYCLDSQ